MRSNVAQIYCAFQNKRGRRIPWRRALGPRRAGGGDRLRWLREGERERASVGKKERGSWWLKRYSKKDVSFIGVLL
jgi:hypothetical protein